MAEETMSAEIRTFLEKLLEEKGITNVSAALREDMLSGLHQRLQMYLFTDLTAKLSETDAHDLELLMEYGGITSEDVQRFLNDRIPNVAELLARSMLEFRSVYLNG